MPRPTETRPWVAVNLSPELLRLLAEGRVRVDAIKVPTTAEDPEARDREIATARETGLPVILHFWGQPLTVGSENLLARLDLEDLRSVVRATGARNLQSHLAVTPADAPWVGSVDRQTPRERELLLSRVRANVVELCRQTGLPVLVENMVYWGTRARPDKPGSLRCTAEPGFVAEVVEATGCGMILDLAHAQISAHYLGMTFEDYVGALPLGAVREVHWNRPRWEDGVLRDGHLGVAEEDLPPLDRVLARARPEVVVYEYGMMNPSSPALSDHEAIERGLELLRRALARGGPRRPSPLLSRPERR